MILPLLIGSISNPDVLIGRARTVSVFYDQGVNLKNRELIAEDGINANPIIAPFFHNRICMYAKEIIGRYLSHFDGQYLFLKGDQAPPFRVPGMGQLYLIDSIFLVIGLVAFLQLNGDFRNILLGWTLVSVLPAAFTFMTPSSNRTFNVVIPLIILVSLGIARLSQLTHNRRTNIYILLMIVLLYSINIWTGMKAYYIEIPKNNADVWNYGWKNLVSYVNSLNPNSFQNIVVSDTTGMPYIYFLLYNKVNPSDFYTNAVRTYLPDEFGYEHVEEYEKYVFRRDLIWKYQKDNLDENSLYIIPAGETADDEKGIGEIYFPNNNAAIKLFVKKSDRSN
ncbi:MAG: hypothetical protein WCT77_01485, partial [Bacteroidota bacterium]